jgi:hypothetical protein
MRTLKRNQQNLWYAELMESEPIYALDEHGNKIVAYVDESKEPPVIYYEELGTTENRYSAPVPIEANIMQSNGDMVEREYGLSEGSYEAILVTEKDKYPITKTCLIWHKTEPQVDSQGYALPESADYTILSINKSLNVDKYILGKVIKDDEY